jgi:hypothetical protein
LKRLLLGIVVGVVALTLSGCGGGNTGATNGSGGPPNGQAPAGPGGTGALSPYQQQKLDAQANGVCQALDSPLTSHQVGFNLEVLAVEEIGLSEVDAVTFVKKVASQQCPELIKGVNTTPSGGPQAPTGTSKSYRQGFDSGVKERVAPGGSVTDVCGGDYTLLPNTSDVDKQEFIAGCLAGYAQQHATR